MLKKARFWNLLMILTTKMTLLKKIKTTYLRNVHVLYGSSSKYVLSENGAWCRLHLIKIKLRYRAFIQASFMLSHKLGRTICIFPITAPTREYYRAAPVGARARL